MVNYDPLYEWLRSKTNAGEVVVSATFSEIEEILGVPLPESAKIYRGWWGDEKKTYIDQKKAWIEAGWEVDHFNLDINSEHVTFERVDVSFAEPDSISNVIEKLKKYRIIICPDTSVLLHMVRESEGSASIKQLDEWLKQMNQCTSLFNTDDVGWVVPEQVTREFNKNSENVKNSKNGKNSEKERSPIPSLWKKLISKENIVSRKLDMFHNGLRDAVLELETLARQNQKRIIAKSLVLKEKNGDYRQGNFIHDAWYLVRGDEFPNQKEQQMKDSAILSHLLAFSIEMNFENFVPTINLGMPENFVPTTNLGIPENLFPTIDVGMSDNAGISNLGYDRMSLPKPQIYFWTFDKFNKPDHSPASQFPEGASREFIEIISDIENIPYLNNSVF